MKNDRPRWIHGKPPFTIKLQVQIAGETREVEFEPLHWDDYLNTNPWFGDRIFTRYRAKRPSEHRVLAFWYKTFAAARRAGWTPERLQQTEIGWFGVTDRPDYATPKPDTVVSWTEDGPWGQVLSGEVAR